MTEVTLAIRAPASILTANMQRRLHWGAVAKVKREWRHATLILATQAKLPKFSWADVEIHVEKKGGVLPDADAVAPTAKAILDGLVDAGVLENDNGNYVRSTRYCAPVKGDHDLILVVLKGELAESVNLPKGA